MVTTLWSPSNGSLLRAKNPATLRMVSRRPPTHPSNNSTIQGQGGRRSNAPAAPPIPSHTTPDLEPSWNPGRRRSRSRDFSSLWIVEAGGIEPPSEGASPNASTCVARVLRVAAVAPPGRIVRGQPAYDLGPRAAGIVGAQPEVWRLGRPYGRRPERRGGLIRQPVRSLRLQLSSPARITG